MISSVKLDNFIHLQPFRWKNTGAINIIIGENDTGKTNLLKMLYAVARSWSIFTNNHNNNLNVPFRETLSNKIINTFQPRNKGLGELAAKGSKDKLSTEVVFYGKSKLAQKIRFSFTASAERRITDSNDDITPCEDENFNALFIPPKEVLSSWKAIMSTRGEASWQFGFDDTYTDLIDALLSVGRPGELDPELVKAADVLENIFGGEIRPPQADQQDFLFQRGRSKYTMSVTAEGIKKIGIYATLINNRHLSKGTILFLDEPEAVLHPKAIRKLGEMLFKFGQLGIQLFINTHSYFLLKQFEILSHRNQFPISCCSLQNVDNEVVAEFSDLKEGLPDNPIIDTALEIFDEEVDLKNSGLW